MSTRALFGVASVVMACTMGCMEGSEPMGAQIYYYSALERDVFAPSTIVDRGSSLTPQELAQLDPIFESFDANAQNLFAQPDINERLPTVENAYLSAGRYIELLAKYREDVERQGIARSPAAPRLLWGVIRLGQEAQATQLAVDLVRARPQSADAWFLYGAYWIKYAAEDEQAARRVVLGWSRAVEIDPVYRGFEGVDALTIRREVSRLRAQSGVTTEQLDALHQELLSEPGDAAPQANRDPSDGSPARGVVSTAQAMAQAAGEPPVEGVKSDEEVTLPSEGVVEERSEPDAGVPLDAVVQQQPAPEPKTAQQELLLELAQVQMKLAAGKDDEALALLTRALAASLPEGKIERAEEVLERDIDRFTLVRLSWKLEHDRSGAARQFNALAARPVKRSMTLYKYAMFAQNELEDRQLARTLLEKLKAQDPAFAKRRGVDAMLKAK